MDETATTLKPQTKTERQFMAMLMLCEGGTLPCEL
jgi:hypothetical protein